MFVCIWHVQSYCLQCSWHLIDSNFCVLYGVVQLYHLYYHRWIHTNHFLLIMIGIRDDGEDNVTEWLACTSMCMCVCVCHIFFVITFAVHMARTHTHTTLKKRKYFELICFFYALCIRFNFEQIIFIGYKKHDARWPAFWGFYITPTAFDIYGQ